MIFREIPMTTNTVRKRPICLTLDSPITSAIYNPLSNKAVLFTTNRIYEYTPCP